MKKKPKKPETKMGRPELPDDEKATPIHLFLRPKRRTTAEQIGGGMAGKGIYALLDLADTEPDIVAAAKKLVKPPRN